MGTLTRSAMETAVTFRLGNRTDIATQVTDAVKFAYDDLVTSIKVPENQETAFLALDEGSATYSLPANLYTIVDVRNNTDGERLKPKRIRDYDRLKPLTNAKPTNYAWWRNELIIIPANDAITRVVRMRYLKRLDALDAPTDFTELPREWDEVVVQGAFFRVLGWLGLKQEEQAATAVYFGMIQRRMNRLTESEYDHEDAAKPYLTEDTGDQ